MRRMIHRNAGTIALLACSILLAASAASADDFAGFRIPDNGYRLWTMGLSGFANWSRTRSADAVFGHGGERADFSTRFTSQHETDTRFGGLGASLQAAGDANHNTQESPTFSDDRHAVSWIEDANVFVTQSWYRDPSRWFVDTRAFARLYESQDQRRGAREVLDPTGFVTRDRVWDSDRRRLYTTNFTLSAGIGWGRVRNATAVFETQVLESRLQAAGALAHPLSDGARQRLAALLYSRNDATRAYERPASRLWASLEQILRDDGALSERALAAKDVFRLTEPYLGPSGLLDESGLPRSPLARRVGWAVSVNLLQNDARQSVHDDFATSRVSEVLGVPGPWNEFRGASSSRVTADGTLLSLDGEHHRPLGPRVQWDSEASYQFSPRHDARGYGVEFATQAGWCFADRWLASASAGHARVLDRDGDDAERSDVRSSSLGGSLQYFVTDHLAAHVEAVESWNKEARVGFADQFRNGGSVSFGLTYRFSGYARIADVFPAGGGH